MKIPGLAPSDLDYLRPYFMGENAGPECYRYVVWIDIMGARAKLLRSVRTAAIPIMKLHVAALTAVRKNKKTPLELFPMIDGIYIVSQEADPVRFFFSDVFRSMAAEFLAVELWERSVVRAAVAYGPVILGRECKAGAQILQESTYSDSMLIGMPLVQAFVSQTNAPPFEIYVHESARAFAPAGSKPLSHILWRWWLTDKPAGKLARALLKELDAYYDHCAAFPTTTGYAVDRIAAHRRLAHEYFAEFEQTQSVRKPGKPGKAGA